MFPPAKSRDFSARLRNVFMVFTMFARREDHASIGRPDPIANEWVPVFERHPKSDRAIVLGAWSGHGVAISVHLGRWAAGSSDWIVASCPTGEMLAAKRNDSA